MKTLSLISVWLLFVCLSCKQQLRSYSRFRFQEVPASDAPHAQPFAEVEFKDEFSKGDMAVKGFQEYYKLQAKRDEDPERNNLQHVKMDRQFFDKKVKELQVEENIEPNFE